MLGWIFEVLAVVGGLITALLILAWLGAKSFRWILVQANYDKSLRYLSFLFCAFMCLVSYWLISQSIDADYVNVLALSLGAGLGAFFLGGGLGAFLTC